MILALFKDHFLDLNPIDGSEFSGHLETRLFIAHDFEEDQTAGRTNIRIHVMQTDTSLDVTSIFSENALHIARLLGAICNMNAKDHVFIHRTPLEDDEVMLGEYQKVAYRVKARIRAVPTTLHPF